MTDPNHPFSSFITLMGQDGAKDLVRKINTFMKDFKARPVDPDQDSRCFQDFMVHMEGEMTKHPLWAGSSAQDLDAAVEALEKYLMTKLCDRAFACTAEEVERDQLLTVRMAALQFLTPDHLEIPGHVVDHALLGVAINELNKINLYKAPKDKLVCILNCCRVVNSMLAAGAKAEGIGADDFTPLLIFVVIKSQAAHLASNLAYVERFHMASRLVSEAQYYFTQLCSAATFVELVHAGSFKVNPDEFLANMLAHGALTDEQLAMMASQSGSPMHPSRSLSSVDSLKSAAAAAAAAAAAGGSFTSGKPSGGSSGGAGLTMHPLPSLSFQQQASAVSRQAAPSFLPPMTVEELEGQGASLLSSQGGSSRVAAKHPYAFTSLDQLTLGDVSQLLTAYKELVLKYECLAAALDWHQANPAAAAAAAEPSRNSSPDRSARGSSHPPAAAVAAPAPAAESSKPAAAVAAPAPPTDSNKPAAAEAPPAAAAGMAALAAAPAAATAAAVGDAALPAAAPSFVWPEEPSPTAMLSSSEQANLAVAEGTAAAAAAGTNQSTAAPVPAAPADAGPAAGTAASSAAVNGNTPEPAPVDQLLADLLGTGDASDATEQAGGSSGAQLAVTGSDLLAGDLLAGPTISSEAADGQQQQQQPAAPPSLLD